MVPERAPLDPDRGGSANQRPRSSPEVSRRHVMFRSFQGFGLRYHGASVLVRVRVPTVFCIPLFLPNVLCAMGERGLHWILILDRCGTGYLILLFWFVVLGWVREPPQTEQLGVYQGLSMLMITTEDTTVLRRWGE